jgi:hypothetical protein
MLNHINLRGLLCPFSYNTNTNSLVYIPIRIPQHKVCPPALISIVCVHPLGQELNLPSSPVKENTR